MRDQLRRLRESPLFKRVFQVIGGNSAAQLIVIASAPLITRIYSPEVFGIQGVFLSVVALLAPVVALRYPMAIVLARGNREIRQAEQASLFVALIVCLVVLVSLLVAREPISVALGLDGLGLLVLLVPLMLFFTATQEIVEYRAARFNRFREISVVTALHALFINGSRIVAGLFYPVASTLVSISTAGPAVLTWLLGTSIKERGRSRRRRPLAFRNFRSLRTFLKAKREFPFFRSPADLLTAASEALPVIVLTALSGPAVAGFYTLARSVLNLPTNVIGNAIGNVYYAHFAEKAREDKPLFASALTSTLILLLGPGLVIVVGCLFAPALFSFVFGGEWREAGVYAQWMAVWVAIGLAAVPSVRLAPVIAKQGVLLVFRIVSLALQVGAMFFAHHATGDPLTVVIAFSLVSAASHAGLTLTLFGLTKVFDQRQAVVSYA